MTDVLIRDVPSGVVRAIDAQAARLGLSRSEYLRRQLSERAPVGEQALTATGLLKFAETFVDLDDPRVMSQAWQ
jgi:hypothetical protein